MKKLLLIALLTSSCVDKKVADSKFPVPEWPAKTSKNSWGNGITKEVYADKILGLIVGAAIGDAMGAPTEMWHNSYIKQQIGYVDSLDVHIRTASAEGPWGSYLPAGGTTDDTRWKYLMGQYLLGQPARPDSLNAKDFGKHIINQYLADVADLKATDAFSPKPFEQKMMHINWLQEWAMVAKPYTENKLDEYTYALSKFYGGEMVCGGMLYAPLIGGVFPNNPEKAYNEAFRLGFFDLGYARDITGLTAALVSKAFQPNIKASEIGLVCRDIDPQGFFDARLTGRIANRLYTDAIGIIYESRKSPSLDAKKPQNFKGTDSEWAVMDAAFKRLEAKNQDMPFHAGEIHLINLTALEFAQGDFNKAMEFVVNYGRDNDTVGAVTGAILGAHLGFEKLPKDKREKVLKTNKEIGKMDLRKLAKDIANQHFK